ncbi:MAG: hypothetical protein IKK03_05715 [Lachnospiraceae bacterium]|nr:hypothetical protein [Lachnospiraceae bacterium]
MKKFTPIFILFMCLFFSVPAYAKENTNIITGYTTEGIYYEAITLESQTTISTSARGTTLSITKEFTYDGTVTPSSSLSWTESSGGVTYSGTLYLKSFYYNNSKTVATYKGTLYAQ